MSPAAVESMIWVGDKPWHGLGTQVVDAPTTEQAIITSGLNWTVDLVPVYDGAQRIIAGYKATQRSSDNKILGVVGARYSILQNRDAFRFFDKFLEANEATLETAGSLRGGKRIWVLAKLRRDPMDILPGDSVEKYLLLSNSHDGKQSIRVGFSPIRVVCCNTLAAAISDNRSQLLRIYHAKNVAQTLDDVRDIVNLANSEFEATAEKYRKLTTLRINQEDIKKFVKLVFYGPQDLSSKQEPRLNKLVDTITSLTETGRGADIAGVQGSMWGLYNAITEHLNYNVSRSQDNRLNSLWFGPNGDLNEKALDIALNWKN